MTELKYIITGTGRCGTKYLSEVLTKCCDLPCGHEAVFSSKGLVDYNLTLDVLQNQIISFKSEKIVADSSAFAALYLDLYPQATVIHLIRNPYDVVNSIILNNWFSNTVMLDILKEKFPEISKCVNDVDRAFLYWCLWNELINKRDFLYKIEDDLSLLYRFINKGEIILNKPTRNNSRVDLFISDIGIQRMVLDLSEKYGYKLLSCKKFLI